MTALRFQTRGKHQTSPASLRGRSRRTSEHKATVLAKQLDLIGGFSRLNVRWNGEGSTRAKHNFVKLQAKSDSLFWGVGGWVTGDFMFEEDQKEKKKKKKKKKGNVVNHEKQELERYNSWQQANHVKQYPDPLLAYRREPLIASDSQQRGPSALHSPSPSAGKLPGSAANRDRF